MYAQTMKESIFIGDIHGHLDELYDLLDELDFNPQKHNLYFVGDFIDRGPNPIETVRFVKSLCQAGYAKSVMGNHEEHQVLFHGHHQREATEKNYENPIKLGGDDYETELYFSFSDAELAFLSSLPPYLRIDDYDRKWLLVHAGFMPYISLDEQDPYALMHIRYTNEDGSQIIKSREKGKKYPWTDFWDGPESVIYGHQSYSQVFVKEISSDVFCVGIDTGVDNAYGSLSALILPSMDVVSVPSRKIIAPKPL
jgi:serine/threonine protein phosphatase 1